MCQVLAGNFWQSYTGGGGTCQALADRRADFREPIRELLPDADNSGVDGGKRVSHLYCETSKSRLLDSSRKKAGELAVEYRNGSDQNFCESS